MDTNTAHSELVEKELSFLIVGAFYRVYNALGFGFLESIYARALEMVLVEKGLRVDREYPVAVQFEGRQIGFHRIDLLVEGRVIVEIKSTERLTPTTMRQLRNYLTATRLRLGILLHFGPKAEYYRILAGNPLPHSRPNSL